MEPRESYYIIVVEGRTFCFNKTIFPEECVRGVKSFSFRPGDVVICSYPRAGSAWTRQIVWHILNPDQTPKESIMIKAPHLERGPNEHLMSTLSSIEILEKDTSHRLTKSHLCPEFFQSNFLESGAKFVILTRNPKDVLVSYYHLHKDLKLYRFGGTWDEFYAFYKEGRLNCGDFFHFYESWWRMRDHPNVLFISYEELMVDQRQGVKRLANFLQREISNEQLEHIVSNTSIDCMQADPLLITLMKTGGTSDTASYVRKGIVGDWVNYFTPKQSEYVDRMFEEKLEPLGLFMNFHI